MRRSQPTPEQDIETLTTHCLARGLVPREDEGAARAHIRKLQLPYVGLLIAEGRTEEQAYAKLNEIFADATEFLSKSTSDTQSELEEKICEGSIAGPTTNTPDDAVRLLPGLIALAPFPFDIRSWMLAAVRFKSYWGRTKPAMRYLEVWQPHVSKEERGTVMRRLMETEGGNAAHPLALYANKLVRYFSDDVSLQHEIFGFISKCQSFLPTLSAVSEQELPAYFRENAEQWIHPDDGSAQTDGVIPVHHVNNYAGTCSHMIDIHDETLFGSWVGDVHGDVTLFYVKGALVGSMKMWRDRSIIGLRTMRDAEGRLPVVTGGVYVTTKEITEQAKRAFATQGKWAKLQLDRLPLFPMEFILYEDTAEQCRAYAQKLTALREQHER